MGEPLTRSTIARSCDRGRRRAAFACSLALLAGLGWATVASAAQTARLAAKFSPDRLGASTTITLTLHLGARGHEEQQPLTMLEVELPEKLGVASTTLGVVSCDYEVLLARGPAGCPANSRLGGGEVELQAPLGSGLVHENAAISIYMGEAVDRHYVFEFYASGSDPIVADLPFKSTLLSSSPPFGYDMQTPMPSTELLPGGSAAAVVNMKLVIGPRNLVYYHTVHGRRVGYRPMGISVPEACPHGRDAFPFLARLTFADGSRLDASTSVPCRR